MDVRAVRELVGLNRVHPAHNYHAGKRGISFMQILDALESCYLVRPDLRVNAFGSRIHPHGWWALSTNSKGGRFGIDFNAVEDEQGVLLLVVTAYET